MGKNTHGHEYTHTHKLNTTIIMNGRIVAKWFTTIVTTIVVVIIIILDRQ